MARGCYAPYMGTVLHVIRLAGVDLLVQVSTLVGGFALLAVALHLVERRVSRRLSHQFGWRSVLATGWLGVPLHELSHLAACWLFRHRVVAVSLFDPDPRTGTLGYVQHAYRRRSLYQIAGNFFIGVAPLVGGSLFLMAMLWLLLPDLGTLAAPSAAVDPNPLGQVAGTGVAALEMLRRLFSGGHMASWRLWVFLAIALCTAMHMAPSRPDLAGALPGFLLVLAGGFVANTLNRAVGLWPPLGWTRLAARVISPLVATLALALALQVLLWLGVELGVRLAARRRRGALRLASA